jgi:hypothetical protein|tara:strand:+ start:2138 stop:2347 length:210 start_codon:yes stop_codon:yes gene_type:complete
MKKLLILLGIAFLSLTVVSCGDKKKPPPAVIVEAPDYEPLAEGWKVQSYALIGVAVIIAIALMGKARNP